MYPVLLAESLNLCIDKTVTLILCKLDFLEFAIFFIDWLVWLVALWIILGGV